MAFMMVGVFGAVTILMNKGMKPRLNALGKKNQEVQSRIAKWRIQAIYGIKDVKVLRREEFFAYNYENSGEIRGRFIPEICSAELYSKEFNRNGIYRLPGGVHYGIYCLRE